MTYATWVVAADSSRARIFRWATPAAPLEELETLHHAGSRLPLRELKSDAPGMALNGGRSGGRHPLGGGANPRANEAKRFARELAQRLETAASAGAFSRLVVIAAPAFLGELRRRLGLNSRRRLQFALSREVTRAGPERLLRLVQEAQQPA